MPFEMLVGLNVIDDDRYQAYRQAMMPILEIHSGDFGYDFVVSEVLKSRTANPINRVFTIHFPDEAAKDSFFADVRYAEVKTAHFDNAVKTTTILASYERPGSPL